MLPHPHPLRLLRGGLVLLLALLAPALAAGQGAATFGVCTQPVPRVAFALLAQSLADPAARERAVHTVNQLVRQYCLYHHTLPPIDGQGEPIGRRCTMYSGILSGERVYWADCPLNTEPFQIPQPPPPVEAVTTSRWYYNGSEFQLTIKGAARTFTYVKVREGLWNVGVRPGAVSFDGVQTGRSISGTAYVFSEYCGAIGYEASGTVEEKRVIIEGNAPMIDPSGDCEPVEMWPSRLVFERID